METEPVQHVRERIRRVEKVRDNMRMCVKVVRRAWIVSDSVGCCSGAMKILICVHRFMHLNARIAWSDYEKSM